MFLTVRERAVSVHRTLPVHMHVRGKWSEWKGVSVELLCQVVLYGDIYMSKQELYASNMGLFSCIWMSVGCHTHFNHNLSLIEF